MNNLLPLMAITISIALSGCSNDDPCRKACLLVARCKMEAKHGPRTLGDKRQPPEASCLGKCKEKPEVFGRCEGRVKTCNQLRNCYGPLR